MELLKFSLYTFIVLLGSLFLILVTYLKRCVHYWKSKGIPSVADSIWSLLSEMYKFNKKPVHLLQLEYYKKFGRVFGSYMGFTPQISIAEPHIIKNILVKDFITFHNRMKLKTGNPIFDNLLSVVEDEDWKRIRCIVSPTFTSSRMRKMAYLVRECAERLMENLKRIVEENENRAIDCKTFLMTFSIDVIASTTFGTKLNSLNDPKNEFIQHATQITNSDASYRLLLTIMCPKLVRLLKIDPFGGLFNYFKDFVLHVIKRRENEKTKPQDFLQLLLEAQKGILEISPEDADEDGEKEKLDFKILPKHKTLSSDELVSQCVLFLFAGNETTTNTLAFIMYFLALHPEYQDKLLQEVDEAWNSNKEMNFDVLSKMQYLDAFINETLRKESSGIELRRECTEDYEIPEIGFKVPKGMNVVIPIYSMHHDEEFFPNPEKFNPERFMPESRDSIPPYTYLPFGEGPRNCIGMRFALMILKMCIVRILQDFRVCATEETKEPLEFYAGQGIIKPKKVMVKLEKRN